MTRRPPFKPGQWLRQRAHPTVVLRVEGDCGPAIDHPSAWRYEVRDWFGNRLKQFGPQRRQLVDESKWERAERPADAPDHPFLTLKQQEMKRFPQPVPFPD